MRIRYVHKYVLKYVHAPWVVWINPLSSLLGVRNVHRICIVYGRGSDIRSPWFLGGYPPTLAIFMYFCGFLLKYLLISSLFDLLLYREGACSLNWQPYGRAPYCMHSVCICNGTLADEVCEEVP